MKKVYSFFMIILLSAMFFGCSEQNDSNSSTNEKDEDILTIAQGTDVVNWDQHSVLNSPTMAVQMNVYSYLFRRDVEMDFQPDLVEDYENIDDTTWKFKLKEGIKFHNGDALTSEDVKFSLERVAEDESLELNLHWGELKEVKILDELNFEIITDNPLPSMIERLATTAILPKKYFEENGLDHFLSNPIGSGPYELDEWIRDDRVVLKPFENYFDGEVKNWDEVVFRVIPESSSRVGEALTGNADISVDIPPTDWERITDNDGTDIISGDTARIMLLLVRHTEGYPTSDPKVREAIDYAIDNEALTENLINGAGVPVKTRVPQQVDGGHPDLYDTYNYDVEHAKKLLTEAGYEDGLEITLQAPSGRYLMDKEVAEAIGGMLAEVGITLNVEIMEYSAYSELRSTKENKDLKLEAQGDILFEPSWPLVMYTKDRTEGETDLDNEEADKLFKEALVTMDDEERKEKYLRIQEIAAEERNHIFLYQMDSSYAVSNDINFEPRLDEMFFVPDIERK